MENELKEMLDLMISKLDNIDARISMINDIISRIAQSLQLTDESPDFEESDDIDTTNSKNNTVRWIERDDNKTNIWIYQKR